MRKNLIGEQKMKKKNISKEIVEQEFKAAAKYLQGTLTDSFL